MKIVRKICFIPNPKRLKQVHIGFLEAGVMSLKPTTFGGGEVVLAEFGIVEKAYDVNQKAPRRLAKRLANDYSTKNHPRFVAGSMGPGTKLPTLGHISYRKFETILR